MDSAEDELVVVLHIFDAINLHRAKNTPIRLSASLDRNTLESGERLPGIASTSFDSNLVWQTDRRSVKRMKTENIPIKLEFFSVDRSGIADQATALFGHLVLPMRSIPILPIAKADTIKPRWYRLIGLCTTEWKNLRPEVQLAVFVTTKDYLKPDRKQSAQEANSENETDRSVVIFTNPEPGRLESRESLPIRLLEDRGLLQVGSYEQESDIFLVKIVLKYCKHLGKLLPEENIPVGKLRMRYHLLGDNYPCTLERKPNGTFLVQEKIVINFRTSLRSLKRYFTEIFLIQVEFFYEESVVGGCSLKFGDIIKDDQEFVAEYSNPGSSIDNEKYYQIHPFKIAQEDPLETEATSDRSSSLQPTLKCKFSIKYLSSDRPNPANVTHNVIHPTVPLKSTANSEPENPDIASPTRDKPNHNVPSEVPDKTDIETILHCEDRDLRDIPRTFSYNLLVKNIRFNLRPSPGLWQLSLYHPRADTPLTKISIELESVPSETIDFSQLQLQLLFSSLPDRVLETITAESSKLTLNGPHGLFGFARVDNASLVVGTKEKQSGVLILENQNGESIGMATIYSFLDEVGINFNSRDPGDGPPKVSAAPSVGHLDDQLSYKMLEEQKLWMVQQREAFLVELKRKESAHFARLTAEWKRRRAKESAELAEKLEHTSALTAALEETKKNLTLQTTQQLENRQSVESLRSKLDQEHQSRLEEVRSQAMQIEEDLRHRLQLQSIRCQDLEDQNSRLAKENDLLKQSNNDLQRQLESNRSLSETVAEQKRHLTALEQQLEQTEKSKMFYKQQWAQLIRQVHCMKLEHDEQLRDALKRDTGSSRSKRTTTRKKRSFCWDEDCVKTTTGMNADEEERRQLERVHKLLFEEESRQRELDSRECHLHHTQCCSCTGDRGC
ncbi:centrosomal protein of 120 kDa [Uranotaenia lowii]|uniref:centrosomal protein of 120 kDa n=1 Tax=Uranotaenia lowii TaxID=190385 RepID=UPI0024785AA7|nr:centrosomal protein of 120 kDa [Uranotaenia lowii]